MYFYNYKRDSNFLFSILQNTQMVSYRELRSNAFKLELKEAYGIRVKNLYASKKSTLARKKVY